MKGREVKRSPLFYVGDKYKLVPEISQYFPQGIETFYEPFVGGGSVAMNTIAQDYRLNDINKYVIGLHLFFSNYFGRKDELFCKLYSIIDNYELSCSSRFDLIPAELKREFVKTYYAKFNKSQYERARCDYNVSDRSDFALLYILLVYGFNHMLRFNSKGNFNLPVGNVDFNHITVKAIEDYLSVMSSKKIVWTTQDFRDFLCAKDYAHNDFIYLDPPYLITFSEYNKLWTEKEEEDLLRILNELNDKHVHFAISNVIRYKDRVNVRFLKWSENYNTHSIKSNYISYHDNTLKQFSEVLVTNY